LQSGGPRARRQGGRAKRVLHRGRVGRIAGPGLVVAAPPPQSAWLQGPSAKNRPADPSICWETNQGTHGIRRGSRGKESRAPPRSQPEVGRPPAGKRAPVLWVVIGAPRLALKRRNLLGLPIWPQAHPSGTTPSLGPRKQGQDQPRPVPPTGLVCWTAKGPGLIRGGDRRLPPGMFRGSRGQVRSPNPVRPSGSANGQSGLAARDGSRKRPEVGPEGTSQARDSSKTAR